MMSTTSIISMVLILGIIIGGFIFFLTKVIKKENENS
jgi:hypothetical protein